MESIAIIWCFVATIYLVFRIILSALKIRPSTMKNETQKAPDSFFEIIKIVGIGICITFFALLFLHEALPIPEFIHISKAASNASVAISIIDICIIPFFLFFS